MMNVLTKESLAELLVPSPAPCLSLYQPTHRRYPVNHQDPIRFRNLVKQLEESLLQAYPKTEARVLLKPFHALAENHDFWKHTLDGLAVMAGPDFFRVFRLARPVSELVVVGDSFHITPLWQFLQSVTRYQVLGLCLDKIRLFEGDRDTLEEIEIGAGVPRTMTDALGSELTEPHQTVASYGGVGGASKPMHHGHGGKADETDIDADRFFRSVDRAVLEHYSQPSGLPLILAALPEHHHRFHDVSQNPFLLAEGITINPDAVTNDALRTLAWKVVEPQYEARITKLKNDFEQATASGRGSDDLPQITTAAAAGRVATLVIGDASDVLDDLGELVGKMGGDVLVVPAASMPSLTGVAAIYRY